MGFIDKIKQMFSSPEPEEEELMLSELEAWYQKKLGDIQDDIKAFVSEKKESFSETLLKLRADAEKLETAKLKNENIPAKVRDIMEGNRNLYIKRVRDFADRTKLLESFSFANIDDWHSLFSDFKKELEIFAKATQKGYQVMQEFFSYESRDIALGIKKTESIITSIGDFLKKKNATMAISLSEDISKIGSIRERNKSNQHRFKEKTGQLHECEQSIAKHKAELEKLEAGKSYKELKAKNHAIDELMKEKRLHSHGLTHRFAVIEKAMIKYQRLVVDRDDEKLIEQFINDPQLALKHDKEMKICSVLEKAKQALEKGSIVLKDKKAEKTLKTFNAITESYLKAFYMKLNGFDDKINNLEAELANSPTAQKHEHIMDEIKMAEEQLPKLKKELEHIHSELQKTNVQKYLGSIETQIRMVLGINVRISVNKNEVVKE